MLNSVLHRDVAEGPDEALVEVHTGKEDKFKGKKLRHVCHGRTQDPIEVYLELKQRDSRIKQK